MDCNAPQVLIIYLQYNYIASKLPLNWPKTVLDFAGVIQIFFGNGEGIFSVDCLLQARFAFHTDCSPTLPCHIADRRCENAAS